MYENFYTFTKLTFISHQSGIQSMSNSVLPEVCQEHMDKLLDGWNESDDEDGGYTDKLRMRSRESIIRFIKEYGKDEPYIVTEGILGEKMGWTRENIWYDSFGKDTFPYESYDSLSHDQLIYYFLQLENHGNYNTDKKVDGNRYSIFDVMYGKFK